MRLAVYNVENLFDRAKVMSLETWEEGRPVLEDYAALNSLLGQISYSAADKTRMAALMEKLGLERSDTGPFVILRRNRGGLVRRPRGGGIEIVAEGRADWVGSLELRDAPINEHAMRNTARVMAALEADVLGIVEAESRPVLMQYCETVLPAVGGQAFAHAMIIDGNDERGIDVGLLTRKGYPIGRMRSHVDERMDNGARVFSRDCPVYEVATPSGETLVVAVNHFKSKGYGSQAANDARRKAQAERVALIYARLVGEGARLVAVIGDFNDTPDRAPLRPLLDGTDLADISTHPSFDDGGYPGTHGYCNADDKIDYMMLSPALFARVRSAGVDRRGMWPGVRPKRWDTFAEVTRPEDAASDHAALWADIDI